MSTAPRKPRRKAPAPPAQEPRSAEPAPKTSPEIGADAVRTGLLMRYNPIRGLTPQSLATQLDNFQLGFLGFAALTWDLMEKRDYTLKGVAAKRRKDVARLKLEIVKKEESAEADAHAEALKDFYDNASVVNAIDQNEYGKVSLLIRQMMDAAGKYYAVHEIVWKPGEKLTAEFRFVPLWFFENRTGKLRFMTTPIGGAEGQEMEDGGWLVTKGDGLMETCSLLYVLKSMPFKDWAAYSENFGTPGVVGQTEAAKGSSAGNAMMEAVRQFGQNYRAVIYGSQGAIKEPISIVSAEHAGDLPFPPLVELCDRAMAALWRGNDLSTMSADKKGASVQEGEAELLLVDDAQLITETLNIQVDKWVIRQLFGTDVALAEAKLVVPEREDVKQDLEVTEFLLKSGARIGMTERMNHFGVPEAQKGDEVLHAPVTATERIQDNLNSKKPDLPPTDAQDPLANQLANALATAKPGAVLSSLEAIMRLLVEALEKSPEELLPENPPEEPKK